jgi:hypothetical protein
MKHFAYTTAVIFTISIILQSCAPYTGRKNPGKNPMRPKPWVTAPMYTAGVAKLG